MVRYSGHFLINFMIKDKLLDFDIGLYFGKSFDKFKAAAFLSFKFSFDLLYSSVWSIFSKNPIFLLIILLKFSYTFYFWVHPDYKNITQDAWKPCFMAVVWTRSALTRDFSLCPLQTKVSWSHGLVEFIKQVIDRSHQIQMLNRKIPISPRLLS